MFFASKEVSSKFTFALLVNVLPMTSFIVEPISSVLNFTIILEG